MKHKILGLLAVGLLAGPMAAQATSFNIAFTQAGLGDDGPDWFGTFEDPDAFGLVSSFSAVVNGITYNDLDWPVFHLFYIATGFFENTIGGIAAPVAFQLGVPATVLRMAAFNDQGSSHTFWILSPCVLNSGSGRCGGGTHLGSYVITPAVVPEPGTLALLGLGLAGLGFTRRRRAN